MDCNQMLATNFSNVTVTACEFMCNEETSCENANMICRNNLDCYIYCKGGNYACRYATINATNARNVTVFGYNYGSLISSHIYGSKYNNTLIAAAYYTMQYATINLHANSEYNNLYCQDRYSCRYAG